jgi:hypothetical protein
VHFSVQPDEPIEFGNKVLVIHGGQLSDDVNGEQFPSVFFIELNGHF